MGARSRLFWPEHWLAAPASNQCFSVQADGGGRGEADGFPRPGKRHEKVGELAPIKPHVGISGQRGDGGRELPPPAAGQRRAPIGVSEHILQAVQGGGGGEKGLPRAQRVDAGAQSRVAELGVAQRNGAGQQRQRPYFIGRLGARIRADRDGNVEFVFRDRGGCGDDAPSRHGRNARRAGGRKLPQGGPRGGGRHGRRERHQAARRVREENQLQGARSRAGQISPGHIGDGGARGIPQSPRRLGSQNALHHARGIPIISRRVAQIQRIACRGGGQRVRSGGGAIGQRAPREDFAHNIGDFSRSGSCLVNSNGRRRASKGSAGRNGAALVVFPCDGRERAC